MALISQVLGHLDLQAALEHLADQPRQQPAIAGELDLWVPKTRSWALTCNDARRQTSPNRLHRRPGPTLLT